MKRTKQALLLEETRKTKVLPRKLAFIADLHVGNHKALASPGVNGINSRCQETLDQLQRAVEVANEEDAALVILGDLVDTATPKPQILTEITRILTTCSKGTHILKGNHDSVSSVEGDHALGTLGLHPGITVYEKPKSVYLEGTKTHMWFVPFRAGPASSWFGKDVGELSSWLDEHAPETENVVCGFHLGVSDNNTKQYMRGHDDSLEIGELVKLAKNHKRVKKFLCGNWHNRQRWERKRPVLEVLQVGALCPTGWDNPGRDGYGGVAVLDGLTMELRVRETGGPRFTSYVGLGSISEAVSDEYVEVLIPSEEKLSANRSLKKLKEEGKIRGYRLRIDSTKEKAQAKRAAASTRSAENIQSALENYIKHMKIEETLQKKELLNRCREYLK
jgi:DNA repair exonuclease SbcCD nuclease subunit